MRSHHQMMHKAVPIAEKHGFHLGNIEITLRRFVRNLYRGEFKGYADFIPVAEGGGQSAGFKTCHAWLVERAI